MLEHENVHATLSSTKLIQSGKSSKYVSKRTEDAEVTFSSGHACQYYDINASVRDGRLDADDVENGWTLVQPRRTRYVAEKRMSDEMRNAANVKQPVQRSLLINNLI